MTWKDREREKYGEGPAYSTADRPKDITAASALSVGWYGTSSLRSYTIRSPQISQMTVRMFCTRISARGYRPLNTGGHSHPKQDLEVDGPMHGRQPTDGDSQDCVDRQPGDYQPCPEGAVGVVHCRLFFGLFLLEGRDSAHDGWHETSSAEIYGQSQWVAYSA